MQRIQSGSKADEKFCFFFLQLRQPDVHAYVDVQWMDGRLCINELYFFYCFKYTRAKGIGECGA